MKRARLIFRLLAVLLVLSGPVYPASSRPLPLAYNESTFGSAGAGRNYTSLQAWENDTDVNCAGNSRGEVLTCYPDEVSYDQTVAIGIATVNSSYFRVIRAAPGFERRVVIDSAASQDTQAGVIWDATESNFGLYDLTVRLHVNDDVVVKALFFSGCQNIRVAGCVIGPLVNANSAGCVGMQLYGGATASVTNTVFRGSLGTDSLYAIVTSTTGGLSLNNSVIYKWANGYWGTVAGTGTATNCIFDDNSGETWGNGPSWVTSIRNADGFNGFVDAAGGDFRLKSTAALAIDQGTSLSGTFTDDFEGDVRPYGAAWDIGIDEYRPQTGGAWVWCVN
ncbi:MAG: hypothetical protein HZB23_03515 [Deltaproteobacteria bacterium]|nr:hypothetical protein [Deltaproteobacteria bacterium]